MKTAVQINSAANSDFSANSALMVLDVLVMTSVVAKKFANLEVVKLNQVRIRNKLDRVGSRVGAMVRALASHQCAPGSIPGPGVICGLSMLLVLYNAP